jgi:hypothetical protein
MTIPAGWLMLLQARHRPAQRVRVVGLKPDEWPVAALGCNGEWGIVRRVHPLMVPDYVAEGVAIADPESWVFFKYDVRMDSGYLFTGIAEKFLE